MTQDDCFDNRAELDSDVGLTCLTDSVREESFKFYDAQVGI